LETLEEINIQNHEFFIDAGGESFGYIPALNDEQSHIELISTLILQHVSGWPEFSEEWSPEKLNESLAKSKELAKKSIYNKN